MLSLGRRVDLGAKAENKGGPRRGRARLKEEVGLRWGQGPEAEGWWWVIWAHPGLEPAPFRS